MDPITIALLGGTALAGIFGSGMQASASKQAAQMQANASAQSTAAQERMYQQTRADNEPWRQAGMGALNQLQSRFGIASPLVSNLGAGGGLVGQALTGLYGDDGSSAPQGSSRDAAAQAYLAANPDLAAEWANTASRDKRFNGPADYVDWHKANYPGEQRSEGVAPQPVQQAPAEEGPRMGVTGETAVQDPASLYAYDPTVAQTGGYQVQSRENYVAPNSALPGFNPTLQARQEFRPLDTSIDAFRASPDYEFRKSEALKGVNAGMAAAGGLGSGRRALALAERASNLADGEYGDWYARTSNQYNADRSRFDNLYESDRGFTANQGNADRARTDALYAADRGYAADRYDTNTNSLLSMAGLGTSATSANQNAASQFANAYGQATTGAANAQAAGQINAANAWSNGLNNIVQTGAYLYGQGGFGGGAKAPTMPTTTATPPFNPASLY